MKVIKNKGLSSKRPKATPKTQQTIDSGIYRSGFVSVDHPAVRLTPAKMKAIFDSAEQGDIGEQHALFLDMEEQDSAILANLQTRKRAVLGVDWQIVPPNNPTSAELLQLDAVKDLFDHLDNFEDVLMDLMDAVGHGFSALEIQWQFDGNHWQPERFTHRNPAWFLLDPYDNLLLKSPDFPLGAPLQPLGWVVHLHKSRGVQVARSGLFRTLAWLYMFKHYSARDFAEFLELYGMPIRIGKYGAGTTAQERQTLLRALIDIGHNASGIMPDSMQIELHNAAQNVGTNNPFLQMVDWCVKSIARLILGQTLTSGADGKSSTNALGNVHNEVRRDLLISDVKQLQQTLTTQIILPFLQVNFPNVDAKRIPRFEFDTTETEDFVSFAESLPKLVSVGVQIPEQWARERLGIPTAEEKDLVLSMQGKAQPQATHATSCGCGCHAVALSQGNAKKTRSEFSQEFLDEGLEQAFANIDFNQQLEPMVKRCLGVVLACSSYEEASDKLAQAYPNLSSQQHFDYLEKAIFLSELLGNVR